MSETKRPPDDDDGGGLTGATGSLTPPGSAEPFVPAERREVEDPQAARPGTASMKPELPPRGSVPPQAAGSDADGDERVDEPERF